jgi:endonuclease YncB( thermonuclease family)
MLTPNEKITCQVLSVIDGDTIKIHHEGKDEIIRMQWIDAPEIQKNNKSNNPEIIEHWRQGELAKQELIELIGNKPIIIYPVLVDIYGRWVSDCYLSDKTNIQSLLCKLGLAISYYLPTERYEFSDRELSILLGVIKGTALANRRKLGFWSSSEIIFPHSLRKALKNKEVR